MHLSSIIFEYFFKNSDLRLDMIISIARVFHVLAKKITKKDKKKHNLV